MEKAELISSSFCNSMWFALTHPKSSHKRLVFCTKMAQKCDETQDAGQIMFFSHYPGLSKFSKKHVTKQDKGLQAAWNSVDFSQK
jgi:hypothetical protein